MMGSEPSLHDRSHRVDHMITREIKARRDLGLTGRLLMSLLFHQVSAIVTKLDPGIGVDAILYTYLNHSLWHSGKRPDHDRASPCRKTHHSCHPDSL